MPRVRTVVRGERASRSIVNKTTALWSIWKVSSLILADLVVSPIFVQTWGPENDEYASDWRSTRRTADPIIEPVFRLPNEMCWHVLKFWRATCATTGEVL